MLNQKLTNMKTKIEFFKENIIFVLIWNITAMPVIIIPIKYVFTDTFYFVLCSISIYVVFVGNTMKDWYTEYRIDELEKQINPKN